MNKQKVTPVTGHWKKMYDPNYLGSWDIEDGDIVVTIDRIELREMFSKRDNELLEKPVIVFKENIKPLIVNITNSKTISDVLKSDKVEDWIGRKIQLGVSPVKAGKDVVDAIRVRPVVPKAKTLNDDRFRKMLDSIEAGAFTVEAARERFNLTPAQVHELENLTA